MILQARDNRKNPTRAEALLWEHLRKHQLGGLKFLRKHIIQTYIVDFYCPVSKLIIEIDGPIHPSQKANDKEREDTLRTKGYGVIRFSNQEVVQNTKLISSGIYDMCMRRIESFNNTKN